MIGKKKEKIREFYMEVRKKMLGDIEKRIKENGIIKRDKRIVVEKKIGRDID